MIWFLMVGGNFKVCKNPPNQEIKVKQGLSRVITPTSNRAKLDQIWQGREMPLIFNPLVCMIRNQCLDLKANILRIPKMQKYWP